MTETQSVIKAIDNRTVAEPDGTQNAHGNVWTSYDRLKGDAVKDHTGFTKESLNGLVGQLEADGKIVTWHGLLAPATPEHLLAIIENENMADVPRALLIGKCNELLSESGRESDT